MEKTDELHITEKDLSFAKNNIIGSGAFGQVYLAKNNKTKEIVAVKKVFQDSNFKNRELSIMQELSHPNIVKLLGFYYTNKSSSQKKTNDVYLNVIMDYIPETLSSIISKYRMNNKSLPLILIKLFSFQMIKSIGYLQSLSICHRDIKPQNLLINPEDYTLKLCDFGCAKHLVQGESNLSYICSRYYRPPELILGKTDYSTQLDVWSIGCVIAELVLLHPIFTGKKSTDQIVQIMKILGTPSIEQIKEMNNNYRITRPFPNFPQKQWKDVFSNKIDNDDYIDLVSKLLVYEPNLRLTPYKALCHPFFDELRDKNTRLPNGKSLPKHLFEFKNCEIQSDKENIQFLMINN